MLGALNGLIGWIPLGLPAFLFVITVVVFFHELGHFAVARLCGVRVETFSIGFGPAIVRWHDRKGTEWKISWVPLGGYVKFFGDQDAMSTPDRDQIQDMSAPERGVAFPLKPLPQRALVVLAGPVANFILAIVIFAGLFAVVGRQQILTHIGKVSPGAPAAAAGVKAGDIVRFVDGKPVQTFEQLQVAIKDKAGRPLSLTVSRQGKLFALRMTPSWIETRDLYGGKTKILGIGISPAAEESNAAFVRLGPLAAIAEAGKETWFVIDSTLTYVWRIVTGASDTKQLTGPIGIAKVSRAAASAGFMNLIGLIALISVSIGLVNLFPIPILDGGHLLYYGCEAVLGRPLGARAQDIGFRLGLAVMLGLFFLATWNDLVRPSLF